MNNPNKPQRSASPPDGMTLHRIDAQARGAHRTDAQWSTQSFEKKSVEERAASKPNSRKKEIRTQTNRLVDTINSRASRVKIFPSLPKNKAESSQ